MSWITNVIVLFSLEEYLGTDASGTPSLAPSAGPIGPIAAINEWLEDNVDGELENVASLLSGGLEAGCYAGALNYVDIDEFLAIVKAQPWRRPDTVQVLIKDQENPVFTVHTL